MGALFSREFLCQSSHIPYHSVSQCILLSRSLNRSVPADYNHLRTHHSSISSSTGATPRKQRPPLSDIKTCKDWWAWRPTHAPSNDIIEQAAWHGSRAANGSGNKAQAGGFTSLKRPRGVVVDRSYSLSVATWGRRLRHHHRGE